MGTNKFVSPSRAAGAIPRGSTVLMGLGACATAFAQALAAKGTDQLTLYSLCPQLDVLLLAASGCAARVFAPLPQRGRQLAAAADWADVPAAALREQLAAALKGLPQAAAAIPAPLLHSHPELYRTVPNAFGGDPCTAARPLHPDFAVVHAARADAQGRFRLDPRAAPAASEALRLAAAADAVLVFAEQVVTPEAIGMDGPGLIDAEKVLCVAEAPYGAYPESFPGRYTADAPLLDELLAAESPVEARELFRTRLGLADGWGAQLERVGIRRLLALTQNRRGL